MEGLKKKNRWPKIFKQFQTSEMFKAEETSLTAKMCFKVEMGSPFQAKQRRWLAQVAGCYSPCSKLLDTKWSNKARKLQCFCWWMSRCIMEVYSNMQRTEWNVKFWKWFSKIKAYQIYIYIYQSWVWWNPQERPAGRRPEESEAGNPFLWWKKLKKQLLA